MKVAYIDINDDDCLESYCVKPNRYGGGRVIASAMQASYPDFHIFADSRCFEGNPLSAQCFSLNSLQRRFLREGAPVRDVIQNADNYDIFFHHFSNRFLNLDGCRSQKQVVWPVGWREYLHERHSNAMYFDIRRQEPIIRSSPNIFQITIGPRFDEFVKNEKEDFVFQCSRHFPAYRSIEVAKMCLDLGIKAVFAGSIESGYPLMDFIDSKTTFFVGPLNHEDKNNYYKRAIFNSQFQNYGISVTLAAKEAASFGCAIVCANTGGYTDFVKHGVNGFFIHSSSDLERAWSLRSNIDQKKCYDMALSQFSEKKMIESVHAALSYILHEN